MSDERTAYLVGGVRTPMGRYGGALAEVRPDDLAALVLRTVIDRAGVPDDAVDEVVFGAANQAGEDNRNVARMATLLAGLPESVPGYTVNRLCASGLQAIVSGAQAIRTGEADVVVAGGVESMTRAPWVMAKPGTPWAKPGAVADTSLGWRFTNPRMAGLDGGKATIPMGETAEEVAAIDGITREDCDAWALRSHERAVRAANNGAFDAELVVVPTGSGEVTADEGPRPDTSLERLARLKPAFREGGIVTAGSSSPLSDGAAAVVVASGAAVSRLGLTPRARIVASGAAGVAPSTMAFGPVEATRRALGRASWEAGDLDVVEINEAFAAQVLCGVRRLGLDPETVNADGGAIALGHPLGCSGARVTVTLLGRMERAAAGGGAGGGNAAGRASDSALRGLATLCIGVGQGLALLVEQV